MLTTPENAPAGVPTTLRPRSWACFCAPYKRKCTVQVSRAFVNLSFLVFFFFFLLSLFKVSGDWGDGSVGKSTHACTHMYMHAHSAQQAS